MSTDQKWLPPVGGIALATVGERPNTVILRHQTGAVFSTVPVGGKWEHDTESLTKVRPVPIWHDFTLQNNVIKPALDLIKTRGLAGLADLLLKEDTVEETAPKFEEPMTSGAVVRTTDGRAFIRVINHTEPNKNAWQLSTSNGALRYRWSEISADVTEILFEGVE